MSFPIDLAQFRPLAFTLDTAALDAARLDDLRHNVQLARDSLIFFTALANTKGLGGHTGGAFDIIPEALIASAFIRGTAGKCHPVLFDEAGHRVAMQYLMAVLEGRADTETLLHYREYGHGLYGHPERDEQTGIGFSSGRLGHLWSYVNGVAEAEPGKILFLFGSDGSQQEGDDAEAARYAVARGLAALYAAIHKAIVTPGPAAVVIRRSMAPKVDGIEGSPKGHDVIAVDLAVSYLKAQGHAAAAAMLEQKPDKPAKPTYLGSTPETAKNRDEFGKIVVELLQKEADPKAKVLVVDSDLEGSCGLHHIRKALPELYVRGGIMERNNFSVAAGFGSEPGRQGIFATFAAFQEMLISEITMARLNRANVLAHFSHSGVDDMADNTCHFGVNNFFADNGLPEGDATRLHFPADALQLRAVLEEIFWRPGLRFLYSTRSATPFILNERGDKFFGDGYRFTGADEIIREGRDGYIVAYGEMLWRALHAVETLKAEGVSLGLINKPVLNVPDEAMLARLGKAPLVLVVESQNIKTGLGARFGTWLLERGFAPKYAMIGSCRPGKGGLNEQIPTQGLAPEQIAERVRALLGK